MTATLACSRMATGGEELARRSRVRVAIQKSQEENVPLPSLAGKDWAELISAAGNRKLEILRVRRAHLLAARSGCFLTQK